MKKITYMFFCILFIMFFTYSHSLYVYFSGQTYDAVNKETFEFRMNNNMFVSFKDELIHIRDYINEKTKHNFVPSGNKKILGYYLTKDKGVIELSGYSKYSYEEYGKIFNEFNSYLKSKNIDFVYMEGFQKNHFEKKILKKYDLIYDEDSYKKFFSILEQNSINYIDSKSIMEKIINKDEALFYKTDYHWTSETAKKMALYFGNYVNNQLDYDLNLDVLDENNFYPYIYQKQFRGYYSRIFGLSDKFYDNFYYYLYKDDINTKFSYRDNKKEKVGTFNNALYDNVFNISKSDIFTPYDREMHGTKPYKKVKNYNISNGKKLLVIADSQFFAMGPYVSLLFKNVDVIDIRKNYGDFSGSVKKYIENYNPDLVLYLTTTFDINDCKKILK